MKKEQRFSARTEKQKAESKSKRHPKLIASFDIWNSPRSILGPTLFNIFLDDLLEILINSDICNFADDNAISVASKNGDTLLRN